MAGRVQQDAFIDDSDESWWDHLECGFTKSWDHVTDAIPVPCVLKSSIFQTRISDHVPAAIK